MSAVTVVIPALQRVVNSGGSVYPMFVGFLAADDIARVAEAPSFMETTGNDDIATDVLAPSHKSWQRPVSAARTTQIAALFSGSGEFMPNPVLLSENIAAPAAISVTQVQVGGVNAPSVEITVPIPAAGLPKPLWILDGQHRIGGLAQSVQRKDPVPLVLLLNQGHTYYGGSTLAKIFAQVTTEAKPLGALHNEWLTYAFRLQKYAAHAPAAVEFATAMEAVGRLCTWPQFRSASGVAKANPFHGRIQFNDYLQSVAPAPGGFVYTCQELTSLFRGFYFSQPPTNGSPHLPADRFAEQFLLAHEALVASVPAPQNSSVFFGTAGPAGAGQKIVQDAFIAGVAAHLLKHGVPTSWAAILQGLNFPLTNWNFKNWTVSLSGSTQAESKQVARTVFENAFRDLSLPTGTLNLGDYLQGDRAKIQLSAYEVSASGRIKRKTALSLDVDGGSVKTMSVAPRTSLKLTEKSANVASITVTDKNAPPGRLVDYTPRLRAGLDLSTLTTNPVRLLVTFHYYGGVEKAASVDVAW